MTSKLAPIGAQRTKTARKGAISKEAFKALQELMVQRKNFTAALAINIVLNECDISAMGSFYDMMQEAEKANPKA